MFRWYGALIVLFFSTDVSWFNCQNFIRENCQATNFHTSRKFCRQNFLSYIIYDNIDNIDIIDSFSISIIHSIFSLSPTPAPSYTPYLDVYCDNMRPIIHYITILYINWDRGSNAVTNVFEEITTHVLKMKSENQ